MPDAAAPRFDTLAIRVWLEASEEYYQLAAPSALLIVLVGLPAPSDVSIEVYDVAGRRVGEIEVKGVAAGWQRVPFAGRDPRGPRDQGRVPADNPAAVAFLLSTVI